MVLYFTGTGNSRYVAEQIAEALNDSIVSINDIIKKNEVVELNSVDKPYVIVTPIYGWRIPAFIEKFLIENTLKGTMRFYVICTCGDSSGNAYSHLDKLCIANNIKLKGFAEVIMPENYLLMFDIYSLDDVKQKIVAQNNYINKIALKIKNDEQFVLTRKNKVSIKDKFLSGAVHSVFDRFIVNSKGFHTDNKCVLCGKCENVCPFNNIKVKGKVVWGQDCTHCCSCIAQCPTQAIQYKKATLNRKRYYLPENSKL